MAFMIPTVTYLTADEAFEYVVDASDPFYNADDDKPEAGFYARLSAPGYMDCTDWMGPYETEGEALRDLCEFWEVDEHGNDLEAV